MSNLDTHVTEEQLNQLYALERRLRLLRPDAGLRETFDEMLRNVSFSLDLAERQSTGYPDPKRKSMTLYTYNAAGNISGIQNTPVESKNEVDNFLVSSLCESGEHAPCLDLDFAARATLDPRWGLTCLTFERTAPKKEFERLLHVLARVGIIDPTSVGETLRWCERAALKESPTDWFAQPMMICAVPTRLVASSNASHRHLYFNVQMSWEDYQEVLTAFRTVGFISQKWFEMSMQNGMSHLIKIGITKTSVNAKVPRQVIDDDYGS